ncbi:MAG TPA: GTPase Era [Bellilinea sp.]|nr:GTPase Era [Bellilinea sp.]
MTELQESYRAGYTALVGRPNVGKSTLMNKLLGQKVAAVSPRPQTTRLRQLGILTDKHAQVVFMDTPGLHLPVHKLGEYMNQVAEDSLRDADVICWLVDASAPPTEEDRQVAERLTNLKHRGPVILVLNKVDVVNAGVLAERSEAFQSLLPQTKMLPISAITGQNCDILLQEILTHLPEGAPFFSEDQVTDFYERDIAAELIREAALNHLREEIPHGMAVRIDEFTERTTGGAYIHATLLVERESHKGIVIGHNGDMLKRIGSSARGEIESMSGRKVFLELKVKVNANWRNRPDALRWLGYTRDKD